MDIMVGKVFGPATDMLRGQAFGILVFSTPDGLSEAFFFLFR